MLVMMLFMMLRLLPLSWLAVPHGLSGPMCDLTYWARRWFR
jgi:hypothetical protein